MTRVTHAVLVATAVDTRLRFKAHLAALSPVGESLAPTRPVTGDGPPEFSLSDHRSLRSGTPRPAV
jgi:hypothetical protein